MLNREIKSSDEVVAGELPRADAKFLARAVVEVERFAVPDYRPADTPRISPLVMRTDCGDAVVN